jgi:hypothetical protein
MTLRLKDALQLAGNNELTGANTFSGQNTFSDKNTFSADNTFSGKNTFSGNNSFSGQNNFSNGNTFSAANTFSGQNTFSNNNTFSGQNTFSNNNSFSGQNNFSNSNSFSGANTFSNTNTFTAPIVLGSHTTSSVSSASYLQVNDVSSATLYPNSIQGGVNYFYSKTGTPTTSAYWSIMHVSGASSSVAWELAGPSGSSSGQDLYFRDGLTTTWNSKGWRKILDSSNYTSYAPTKTGSGASGTWGISISGTAAKATALVSTIGISLTGNVKGSVTGINAGSSAEIEANMKWAVYDDDDTNVDS